MNHAQFLRGLYASQRNVRFADLQQIVVAFGFELKRTRGSHWMYGHAGISEQLNLQEVHGQAKPYQVKQFLKLIERRNLTLPGGTTDE